MEKEFYSKVKIIILENLLTVLNKEKVLKFYKIVNIEDNFKIINGMDKVN